MLLLVGAKLWESDALETNCPFELYWLSALASTLALPVVVPPAHDNAALEAGWLLKAPLPVPAPAPVALTVPVAV